MKLYEGMFLIDNDLVREDWSSAKTVVTSALEKHGATVHTARRWDERALAYPIKGRRRATFLLTYFEIDGDKSPDLRRDLEINDNVLRYLLVGADALPETEKEAAAAEGADDFEVPAPPADSVGSYRPIQTEEDLEEGEGEGEGESEGEKAEGESKDGESKDGGDGESTGEKAEGGGEAAAESGEATAEATAQPAANGAEESK